MTRITNADQVLMLLRMHLDRARRPGRLNTEKGRSKPLERAQQLASVHGLSEPEIARTLIGALLTEEFGPELAIAPRFQELVEDIRATIERDEAGRLLLRKAVAQLSADG